MEILLGSDDDKGIVVDCSTMASWVEGGGVIIFFSSVYWNMFIYNSISMHSKQTLRILPFDVHIRVKRAHIFTTTQPFPS